MSGRFSRPMLGIAVAWMLCGQPALAGLVTVNVTDRSGATAEDTVAVFDPLDASPPPAHASAVIDQINKKFVPRVTVIRTGTAVMFPNSDQIRHQVYSFSEPKIFTLKLYAGSPRADVVFDKPGLVILGCNIHDTMVAFVGVVDSPYYVKIPASGTADLTLPPGRYRLRVWHPGLRAAIPPRPIQVGSEPMSIPLAVDIDPTLDTFAAWPE